MVSGLRARVVGAAKWIRARAAAAGSWLCARWPVCRWIKVAATNDEATRADRRHVWALAFFFALAAFLVLRQIDDFLAAMHPNAGASYRIANLSDVGVHWPDAQNARNAVDTWVGAADPGLTGPLHLVVWYLVADVVFAFAYTALLVLSLGSGQRMIEAHADGGPLRSARLEVARFGIPVAALLLLTDLVENLTIGLLVPSLAGKDGWQWIPDGTVFWLLAAATTLKWLLVVLVASTLVAVAAGVLAYIRGEQPQGTVGVTRTNLRGFWQTLTTLRIQVAAVVLFGLFLFGPLGAEQLSDVIRRWNSTEDFLDGIAALVVTAWLSLVIYVVSWRALLHEQETSRKALPRRSLVSLGFLGIALIGVGLIFDRVDGVAVAGGILVAFAILSAGPTGVSPEPGSPGVGGGFLPPLLTVLPTVLLGLAAFAAGLSELLYAKRWLFLFLVGAGLAVQFAGWWSYALIRKQFDPDASNLGARLANPKTRDIRWHRRVAYASSIAALALCAWVWFLPWSSADVLGAVGVLAGFSIVLVFAGYLALRVEQRYQTPAFLGVLGFRRIPVLALVVLWLAIATQIDKGGYHDVRRIDYEVAPGETQRALVEGASTRRVSPVETKWTAWLKARGLTAGSQTGERTVVPLVLVASEGGGIRAAFWTADVLDCVVDHAADCEKTRRGPRSIPPGSVFAASGVSGGSLGLVAHVAHSTSGSDANDTTGAWVAKRLGSDYLTPAWARMLFVDTPNALLRLDPDDDRASMLEQAWERSWDDLEPNPLEQGLFALAWKHPNQPLLLLNGTSVQDGCRVNTSVLDADIEALRSDAEVRLRDCRSLEAFETGTLNHERESWVFGASHDLRDFLCGSDDVRLSTGALLSARFPYVTPSGRVAHCDNPDIAIFVVDGGYFDTSAASPIVELWAELEPHVDEFNRTTTSHCVVPFFLQIDNHYKETRSPAEIKRPSELGVPLTAVRAARDARENDARQTAALEFDGAFGPYAAAALGADQVKRYAHLYPRAHAGTKAPLGWALSEASMDDLRTQLVERLANTLELDEIQKWFDPQLRCVADAR